MISDCSSMRIQSTSCCFTSASDIVCPPFTNGLPVEFVADTLAPQFPGAHGGGLVDGVREPAFLRIQRSDGRAALEGHGPMLDARIDLSVDGTEHSRLQSRPARHTAVRAHEHD